MNRYRTRRGRLLTGAVAVVLAVLVIAAAVYFHLAGARKAELYAKQQYYSALVQSEAAWLCEIQLENGALPFRGQTDGTASVTPYFSDIAAWGLLKAEKYDAVKAYMQWHFAHLNTAREDKNGIAGTIYNYEIEVAEGTVMGEQTDQSYDSVDSYAATFLTLVCAYVQSTGDQEFLRQHAQEFLAVLEAMESTIDRDGLSVTKPSYPVKYLMDNAEVYAALKSTAALLQKYPLEGSPQILERINGRVAAMEDSLENLLWNQQENRYEIGLDDKGEPLRFQGWHEFYPDATAQVFPILFGVIQPEDERAQALYEQFCTAYAWEDMAHYETDNASFYWGLSAYAGALMQDKPRVHSYMAYYNSNILPRRDYPLYCADAGWVILACDQMADDYQEQMQKIDPLGIVPVH
ncbi:MULTISPECIES: hypothetical protein [unclassified Clostridium]|uniref:hypothetical protein n=1 Tax=unclassified Clostridium TaxID=2614128 RepID=UPI001105DA7D|nr:MULTISPECIES: hypothetical protein [unclassified Clostridium]